MNIAEAEPSSPAGRKASRPRARAVNRAYTRRRRSPVQALAAPSPLSIFWNEHAVKAGVLGFWLWFGAANWHKLQAVSAGLLQGLSG